MSVILETSIGDITVDLYVKERPRACLNFLKLCKIKYYNFHLFHTIQHNFIAQTGDPTGTGRGGESIYSRLYGEQARYFEAELNPKIKHTKNGTLSMVNDGNGRHGSQFFITLNENADYLDKQNHTVFGEVSEGFEIIEKLNSTILDDNNRPLKDVRIYHTVVLDDPLPDPPGLDELIPCNSPAANTQEHLEPRIGADSDTDDEKGLTQEELDEISKDREARTNAKILEVIGDIPDADIKPPDNVLFVCKLNPATTDGDIEIIFSRFGKIVSCEVIRNKKTNESLQYAFVEFEKAEDCEKAYFKMDNVLIDDRRIHVDFSQSVSKEYQKHKMEKEEDEGRPQYKIKDFEKRNDNYEYVFEPESERLPEKASKKHHNRAKKPKRRSHSSSSEESDRSPSPARNRKKYRSPLKDRKDRPGSPLEKRRNVESPPVLKNRRRRSRSVEDRRKRRSPSEEDRRKQPSRENRRRSPSPENNRRRRSPSADERRPQKKAERQTSDRRRDRSSEGDRNRRRSRSREESSRKGGKYQDDRRERNNRPRNY